MWTSKLKFETIRDMWLFIRKWWVLKWLRIEIRRHTQLTPIEQLEAGKVVLLTQRFFISGRPDLPQYPGIADRSVRRFCSVLWWRRKGNVLKRKHRIIEYNDMYNSLVQEGYIVMKPVTGGGEMPSVANQLADNLYGWWGLSEAILTKYKASWTILIIPLLFGMWGSPYLKNIWNLIFK